MTEPTRAQVSAAVAWRLRLEAQCQAPEQCAEFGQWLNSDPRCALAWQRLGALDSPFATLDVASQAVLLDSHTPRRPPVRLLVTALLVVATGLAVLERQVPLQNLTADLLNHTGQVRRITLPDHSTLVLGPRSAVDLDFAGSVRRVVLRQGQVFIETAHEGDSRPFLVSSVDGDMQALGTRFTVERDASGSELVVLQSAVRASAGERSQVVKAGQQLHLVNGQWQAVEPADPGAGAWVDGMLQVRDEPLGAVIERLAPYRSGFISLDPQLAGLRVSGSFSLSEADRTLNALAQALPIQVQRFGPLWTRITPR